MPQTMPRCWNPSKHVRASTWAAIKAMAARPALQISSTIGSAQFDDRDTSPFHRHFEQDVVRERRPEAELLQPVEDGLVVAGGARWEAEGDIAAVGRLQLGGRGRGHRGVPPGLALHGVPGPPAIRTMPASVVTLAAACMFTSTCWPTPEGSRSTRATRVADGASTPAMWTPGRRQAADRWQGVVVVAAVPHRPAAGQHGQVGRRVLGRAGLVLAERAYRHPDEGGRWRP